MSSSPTYSPAAPVFKTYHLPKSFIARFVARRNVRGAALWALAFGILVASKATGFATAFPTAKARAGVEALYANNTGLKAILGVPHGINTVAGFTAWNTLMTMAIVGGIWAFLLATKTFRGEEDNGRWELLLAGQTTARRAALNALAGLGIVLGMLYGVTAVAFVATGRFHSVGFSSSAALFFALSVVASAAMFLALGAFVSQLMPTRARAASFCAAIFGASFLVRAMADIGSARWLLNISPLGWVEKLQPLGATQPIWLLPIIIFVLVLGGASIWLAGRRDLGQATFADKATAKPHFGLLKSSLGLSFRLNRINNLSWLAGIGTLSLFFALLTKTAVQAINDSSGAHKVVKKIVASGGGAETTAFLGIAFFLVMTLAMCYAASAAGRIRDDEAQGYLDNLLVRPISRWRWLSGRLLLATGVIALAGLISTGLVWLGTLNQSLNVSFHALLLAGINGVVPPLLGLGIAIFTFGFIPRITTFVAYGVVAWGFLLQMLSSGINLNHWILDTSVFNHIGLAPAASPRWGTNLILIGLGLGLAFLGAWRFSSRDLQNE